jgi:hypothetical protein
VQVIVALAVLVMLFTGLRRPERDSLRTPVAATAIVLLVLALISPLSNVDDLTKPDQRLLFPAVLLLLAGVRWKPSASRQNAAVATAVLAVLGLHLAELQSVQPPLQRLAQAGWEAIPAGTSVTTVAVPANGGCTSDPSRRSASPPSSGSTSNACYAPGSCGPICRRPPRSACGSTPRAQPGLTALTSSASQAAGAIANATTAPPAYIEVVACPPDLDTIEKQLAGHYHRVGMGAGL